MKVGEHIFDKKGNEYVIARIWVHEKWYDLDLIKVSTSQQGFLRMEKK